jgi:drug/metabolite transporter (DMT)-like permease
MDATRWVALKCRALDMAEIIDAHRIFPKFFVAGYGALCWHMALWFEALPNPTSAQAAFVTIVVSVFAPLFNWYASSGRRWDK